MKKHIKPSKLTNKREDLKEFAKRAQEPSISFEEFLKKLKDEGRI